LKEGLYIPPESEQIDCLDGKSCEYGICSECILGVKEVLSEEEDCSCITSINDTIGT